jgi:hypothetical protein
VETRSKRRAGRGAEHGASAGGRDARLDLGLEEGDARVPGGELRGGAVTLSSPWRPLQ